MEESTIHLATQRGQREHFCEFFRLSSLDLEIFPQQKLRGQMTDERGENVTLCSLVDADISSGTRRENDCAVDALAGLRKYAITHLSRTRNERNERVLLHFRTMDFLRCFLHEFGQGEKSLEEALNKSYGQTLKHLHGWTTRESFAVNLLCAVERRSPSAVVTVDGHPINAFQ